MKKSTQFSGRIHHLDHFGLPATDTGRAEKFYTELFGGKVIVKGPCLEGRGARVFIKLGQTHVGLFSESGVSIPDTKTLDSYPRYAFVIPRADFDTFATKIKKNMNFPSEGITNKKILDVCVLQQGLILPDSEGNLLEIFRGEQDETIRLHHIHLDTLDIDASIRFYNRILSLKLIERNEDIAVLKISGDQRFVIHQVKELSEITKTPYLERHVGLTVTSEDFHRILEKLRKARIEHRANLRIIVPRKQNELTTYFKDPANGYDLQIINQDSEAFTKSRSQP